MEKTTRAVSNKMPKLKILSLTAWNAAYGKEIASSLYVVNTNKRHGTLFFTVNANNGITSNVCIPYTFVPIDLTTFAPLSALIVSEDFRRLVQQGHLTIVDNQQVESPEVQDNPKVRKEMERVLGIARDGISGDGEQSLTLEIGSNEVTSAEDYEQQQEAVESSELVQQIIGLSDNDDLLENLLDMRGNELSAAELEYLRENSKSPYLSNYCVEALDA